MQGKKNEIQFRFSFLTTYSWINLGCTEKNKPQLPVIQGDINSINVWQQI